LEYTTSNPNTTADTGRHKNLILIITSLASFFASFIFSGLNVALPSISLEFQANAILLSWVVTAYLLTIGVLQLPFGRLADIVGIKKVFMLGLIIFGAASAASIFANSIILLIVYQVIRGVGGAMIFTNSTAMLTAVFSQKERGRAFGINAASVYTGFSTGPFLGGLLTEHLGWRSIFVLSVIFFIILIILFTWKIKDEWCQSRGEKFDTTGSIIFGISVVMLMYGFSALPETQGIILGLAGAAGLFIFLFWENHSRFPMLNVAVFRRNKYFILANLTTFLSYCAVSAVVFLMSLYLQYIKGFSAEQAGIILLCQPIMQTIFSLVAGKLSVKMQTSMLSALGMTLTLIGLLCLIMLSAQTPLWYIIIVLIVLGTGYGLFASPNSNAVMSSVIPRFYGVAAATAGTMRVMGQISSMAITMIVLNSIIGRVVISADYYPGFVTSTKIIFVVCAILCFAGVFTSLSRRKPSP
jgi:MFS family permease